MADIISTRTDQELAKQLAKWVAQQRLGQNRMQQDICEATGIAISTYKKFEQTGEVSLLRFIAILRSIGKLEVLAPILASGPDTVDSEFLSDKHLTKRKRARRRR